MKVWVGSWRKTSCGIAVLHCLTCVLFIHCVLQRQQNWEVRKTIVCNHTSHNFFSSSVSFLLLLLSSSFFLLLVFFVFFVFLLFLSFIYCFFFFSSFLFLFLFSSFCFVLSKRKQNPNHTALYKMYTTSLGIPKTPCTKLQSLSVAYN